MHEKDTIYLSIWPMIAMVPVNLDDQILKLWVA